MGWPPTKTTSRWDIILSPALYINCITSTNLPNTSSYAVGSADAHETTTIFHNADTHMVETIGGVMDPTRNSGHHPDGDLKNYLSRPIIVGRDVLPVGSPGSDAEYDPWTAIIEQPDVRKRLEGYSLFQAKLHIRVTVNGNPFMYAPAYMWYLPRPLDQQVFARIDNVDANISQTYMYPKIMLNPTTSQGGELVVPFFCPDNWISLPGRTYTNMGRIGIQPFHALKHANSLTGKVVYTIYAWFTDVVLAAPTTLNYGSYTPQSGTEYTKPSISTVASSVAKIAGLMSDFPVIGPFARASEMVAKGLGNMAALFGFSRPIIALDPYFTRVMAATNFSYTNTKDGSKKLALDLKQELSVDPRTVGLSEVDEMDIQYIASKEGWMDTDPISEEVSPNTILQSIPVTPVHWERMVGSEDSNVFIVPPITTVALPFKYWRGSIKYRFMISASAMHRGKLKFVYVPGYLDFDRTNPPSLNRCYTRIVDIAEHRDFTLTIGWHSHRSWLRVRDAKLGSFTNNAGITAADQYDAEAMNGVIHIYLVDSINSPNPSLNNEIFLMTFVSAGDDFEVAVPDNGNIARLEYAPPENIPGGLSPGGIAPLSMAISSSDELLDPTPTMISPSPTSVADFPTETITGASEDISPITEFSPQGGDEQMIQPDVLHPEMPPAIEDIVTNVSGDKHLNLVHMGETVKSIRALVKRFCFHTAYPIGLGTNITEFDFPVYKGAVDYNRHGERTYACNTLLNWFTPCYVGWRGSVRSKYHLPSRSGSLSIKRISMENVQPVIPGFGNSLPQQVTEVHCPRIFNGHGGQELFLTNREGIAEVEFPFQSWKRFAHTGRRFFAVGVPFNDLDGINAHNINVNFISEGSPVLCRSLTRYVAAGDDFSLFFWLGQPVLQTTPLAAYTENYPGLEARP